MTQAKKEHYLAMFDGKLSAERGISRYQPRDDASHIFHNEPAYYEWWYLDASFDNGYHFVTTFHYRNAFTKPTLSTIQFFIYLPDGTKKERHILIDPKDARAHPDYCDVQMGDSYFKDNGDHYEINIKIGKMGARLKLKNTVPPWKPGNGLLYQNKTTGTVWGWAVPVPAGDIEGELILKDETIPVKGNGYHDHNWGNCYMHTLYENWYWGRIHDDNFCIDYGRIQPREAGMPLVNPLLITSRDKVILSTNMLQVDLFEEKEDETFGRKYANRLKLSVDTQGVQLKIDINTRRIAEPLKLPPVTEWEQHYYRFVADYTMQISVDGKTHESSGELLHEYMLL
ncbi:MAG: hypothetical protein HOD85_12150 [Deltaproteobacteria bacterium]|jgi:predicted secreted hydrolase|nr:hypothetical protein [Deltaproteobacteria bacterium]MBT4640345.1 hypothetical protein [Deltaproteobacteria bacterium]